MQILSDFRQSLIELEPVEVLTVQEKAGCIFVSRLTDCRKNPCEKSAIQGINRFLPDYRHTDKPLRLVMRGRTNKWTGGRYQIYYLPAARLIKNIR